MKVGLDYFSLKTASSAACEMVSSISDLTPVAAIPPMVWPSAYSSWGVRPGWGKSPEKRGHRDGLFLTAWAPSFEGILSSAAWRAFFWANSMVLSGAAPAFGRKSRLPLSSTVQIVTSTFSFFWPALQRPRPLVLIAARFTDFLVGRSAEYAAAKKPSTAKSSLDRCKMLPLATQMCQLNVALGGTLGASGAGDNRVRDLMCEASANCCVL